MKQFTELATGWGVGAEFPATTKVQSIGKGIHLYVFVLLKNEQAFLFPEKLAFLLKRQRTSLASAVSIIPKCLFNV